MKTSLSVIESLKLLLLLTSLSHYSGLLTGVEPAKGICDSVAAKQAFSFFLVGRSPKGRLLITAKPDYLVYELHDDSLHEDTISISGVKPVSFKDYFPELFKNENFSKLIHSTSPDYVKVFTVATYLKIFFLGYNVLFSYNMDTSTVETANYSPKIFPPQEFVSASDQRFFISDIYSFFNDGTGSKRIYYDVVNHPDMSSTEFDYTCQAKPGTMVLRDDDKKCDSYDDWDWTESPKGWAEKKRLVPGNIRFYLFASSKQEVYIFDQNDMNITESDVFSEVRQKSYEDFFVCPPPTVTSTSSTTTRTTVPSTITPNTTTSSTTSTQPNPSTCGLHTRTQWKVFSIDIQDNPLEMTE